jgi:M6 family metalloprotease-like protein
MKAILALSSIITLSASLVLLGTSTPSQAINASPFAFPVQQADGSSIQLHVRGDERYHWQEDSAGYTVIQHNNNYFYATRNPAGNLVPTPHLVGKANPRALGLQKHLLPSADVLGQLRAAGPGGNSESSSTAERVPASGDIKNLVVMVRFSDHAGRALPSSVDMDVLFNATSPDPALAPTGSVKAVYLENSYGQMTLNSSISGWRDVSNTEAYYANGVSGDETLWEALKEALDQVDPSVNFNDYDQDGDKYIDSITFIHSGYGAEWGGPQQNNRIWSHRWSFYTGSWVSDEGVRVRDYHISPGLWGTSGSSIGRIGVIAHETGHFFGLPDLYDTNSSGSGIGSYGLMANSWGFDGSQLYPPHFSPWSKIDLGWTTATTISASGNYDVNQAETNAQVYRIDHGYPSGEYLLVENRQPVGFDGAMPQGGLAIWHIDDTADHNTEGYPGQAGWPENGNHYRVALLQADGNFNLERGNNRGDGGDVWHAGGVSEINAGTNPNTNAYQGGTITITDNRIFTISASGANMNFDYQNSAVPIDPPTAPSLTRAEAMGDGSVELEWLDHSDNEDGFKVLRNDGEITSLPADSVAYADTGAPEGTQSYKIRAHNDSDQNNADSNALEVTVILPAVSYAYTESTTYGTRIGNYQNTYGAGAEELTETETNGNPRNRTSRLQHVWQFANVQDSEATFLTVDAETDPGNSGLDDFEFSYSTDGSSYQDLFTFEDGDNGPRSIQLNGVSGNVWLKVVDSDRSRGERSLDSIHIRELKIEWSDEPLPTTAPSNLEGVALSSSSVALSWNDGFGETGYRVEQDNTGSWVTIQPLLPVDSTSTQVSGLDEGQSYTFRVCADHILGDEGCTGPATISTLAAGVPVLDSARGYKVRGVHHVELDWTFEQAVDIYQGSSKIVESSTDSNSTHNLGSKGGGSYTFKVCESNSTTSNCSNSLTVNF